MITLQEILVLITFLFAVGFIITKFIWKPAFFKQKKKSDKACGAKDCGCH
jgi:uncharacterized membrane protein YciS (DUF1049 family)